MTGPRFSRILLLAPLILVLTILVAWGADKPGNDPQVTIVPRPKPAAPTEILPKGNIRVDTTLVLIPVTVTDPLNRFVTGLEKENFRVFEDKVEQSIVQFSSEDAPLSVGVIFDCSGSMGTKLEKSRQAVAQFFKTANPEDEFFLVEFNDRADLVIPFTTSLEEIQNRLAFTPSKGKTALLDAVYLGLHEMKHANNPRKALIIISDGGDNNSRYTETEIKNLVREADVQIYAIGIFEPAASRGRTMKPEELREPKPAERNIGTDRGTPFPGGESERAPQYRGEDRHRVAESVHTRLLSKEYGARNGKYRRVQVKLVQPRGLPPLRAFWRMGYYAPTQ